MNVIHNIYSKVRTNHRLAVMVWLTRYLLAFAFIPSGMKKIMGERFTSIGTENPIGFFFEALFRTGMYWNFLGWAQSLAAVLMMTQKLATIGNLIFLAIITNICFITVSMHFTGTWVITSMMLFASFCLMLWDLNKLQYLITTNGFIKDASIGTYPESSSLWQKSGLALFVISVAYTLIDKVIKTEHLLFLLVTFIAIMIIVSLTIIIEYKNRKTRPIKN